MTSSMPAGGKKRGAKFRSAFSFHTRKDTFPFFCVGREFVSFNIFFKTFFL